MANKPYTPGPDQPDIQKDIKRPGALTRKWMLNKDRFPTLLQYAQDVDAHPENYDKLTVKEARYYLNVLRPAAQKKKKGG